MTDTLDLATRRENHVKSTHMNFPADMVPLFDSFVEACVRSKKCTCEISVREHFASNIFRCERCKNIERWEEFKKSLLI